MDTGKQNRKKTIPKKPLTAAKSKPIATCSTQNTSSVFKVPAVQKKQTASPTKMPLNASSSLSAMYPEPDFSKSERLRAIFLDQLVSQASEEQKVEIDQQLTELARNYEAGKIRLELTDRRLKQIKAISEQQKLLELKEKELERFSNMTKAAETEQELEALIDKEVSYLDHIQLKNVDLGYTEESGHKQLSDALDDTLKDFEEFKKTFNVSLQDLKQYEVADQKINDVEKNLFDLQRFKNEFQALASSTNEKIVADTSKKLNKAFANMKNDFSDSD